MISKKLEESLQRAISLAKTYKHEYTTLDHLVVALIEDEEISAFLRQSKVKVETLKKDLLSHLQRENISVPDAMQVETRITIGFQRVLQRASIQVQSAQQKEITGAHLLVALFAEDDCYASYILEQHNLSRDSLTNYVNIHARKEEKAKSERKPQQPSSEREFREEGERPETDSIIEKYCVNLNEKALNHQIEPVVGRDAEINRIIHILCRRTKNNALLLGDAGVGKTALIEGLAYKLAFEEMPQALQGAQVFSLDMGGLVAGTRFRGDFEERFKGILKALEETNGKAILFIDEAHIMVGTGSVQGGSMDTSNMLKPALIQSKIRCIAATTFKEFKTHLEKDSGLLRRFQKVEIKEPSPDESISILEGLRKNLEDYHQIKYQEGTLKTAVDLSVRHLMDRKLPDKAIDVLDEAGAKKSLENTTGEEAEVTVKDIEDTVARMASIPAKQVSSDDKKTLKLLEKTLKQSVFGQDQAVKALVHSIKLSRSGLRNPEKPVGCYLFSGPTGVGKTEIARQLSSSMGMPLIRFDMSEYMEKHSVSKLIGAPPGYVGFEQGGALTDAVSKTPHAIILLDEIEKAHPDIYNVLLQLMDYGIVTDHHGISVSFRNIILIMTTNAGATEMAKHGLGFGHEQREGEDQDAINKAFSPEFRNRLDAIIAFGSLTEETMTRIVDKFLGELEAQLKDRHIRLKATVDAKKWLLKHGFDPLYGARPLGRTIDEYVKKPLADQILFGKLQKGGVVSIDAKKEELSLKYLKGKGTKETLEDLSSESEDLALSSEISLE